MFRLRRDCISRTGTLTFDTNQQATKQPSADTASLRDAATRDILRVISQSRNDAQPVFDVILKKAAELCGAHAAALAMGSRGDTHQRMPASYGVDPATVAVYDDGKVSMDPNISLAAKAILTGQVVHIKDMADTDGYRSGVSHFRTVVDDTGIRTNLFVPLISATGGIGALILFRKEIKPYTADEIALVETFSEQAVIAIENVRQFRALQTRLEREAATRDILQVISQSRADELPVLQTIVRNAARLCSAQTTGICLANAERTHLSYACTWGTITSVFPVGTKFDLNGSLQVATTVNEARLIHTHDISDDPLYFARDPVRVKMVEEVGVRTFLTVPLIKDGVAFGCLNLNRLEVRPFEPDEIQLLETFAAQAVIAIENVRQYKALETLNIELGDRVTAQVGEIERMGRLKRFLPPAVADAVVSSGSDAMLSSHRALLGVLFCDIRGFTAFCETAEPEETIEVLQTYHQEMGKLINDHGAGVDHRMGDGIMVLFNDPLPCDDPAGDAVKLAIRMQARMAELCQQWKRLGHRLGFGVGVSLGYATVGMVGYEGRYDYTASGTAINLAARLCDEAKHGEILLSPRAYAATEGDITADSNGEINLKGIREPVEVFRVTGIAAG